MTNHISSYADAMERAAQRDKIERLALMNSLPRTKAALEATFGADYDLMVRFQSIPLMLTSAARTLFTQGPEACATEHADVIRRQLASLDRDEGLLAE